MKNIPTFTYSEHLSHDNLDLEIRGEIFDEAIKQTESNTCNCRVSIFDIVSKEPWGVTDGQGAGKIYFENLSQAKLTEVVKAIKNNIDKYSLKTR